MRFPNPIFLLKSLRRAVYALFHGKNLLVPQKIVDGRLAICNLCPFFDAAFRQCNICTCAVDLKAQLSTESCPKGYWSTRRLTFRRSFRHFLKKICH